MLRQSQSYAEVTIFQFHLTVDIENEENASTTLFTYNMIMIMCIKSNHLMSLHMLILLTIPISLTTLSYYILSNTNIGNQVKVLDKFHQLLDEYVKKLNNVYCFLLFKVQKLKCLLV